MWVACGCEVGWVLGARSSAWGVQQRAMGAQRRQGAPRRPAALRRRRPPAAQRRVEPQVPLALPPPCRYEPESTAAIILTGGDEESEEVALEVCREAEITEVVRQSRPPPPTVYLTSGKNL